MIKDSLFETGLFNEALVPFIEMFYPEGPPNALVDQDEVRSKNLLELKNSMNGWVEEMEQGIHYFQTHSPHETQEKLKNFTEGDALVDVFEALSSEVLIFSIPLNLSAEEMNSFYTQACEQVDSDPQLAQKLFMALLFLNFTEARYWVGLAYCFVKQEHDEMARSVYEFGLLATVNDPMVPLYFAKYLILHGDPLAEDVIKEGMRRTTDEATLEEFQKLSSSQP